MKIAHCLLALAVAGSVSTGASDPQTARADAERQIRAALARWTEAANRGDWKTALDVWAPDLVGWAPSGADDSYAREAEGVAKSAALGFSKVSTTRTPSSPITKPAFAPASPLGLSMAA